MAFTNAQFSTHKAWMLMTRNSFEWPKHWRKAIFRVEQYNDIITGEDVIRVLPRNPEYQIYLDEVEARERPIGLIPPMHLDVAEFRSLDDLERWIEVLERMT